MIACISTCIEVDRMFAKDYSMHFVRQMYRNLQYICLLMDKMYHI